MKKRGASGIQRLGAVVPAAGLSRRMGKEKVLLCLGGMTVLERVLTTLRVTGVEELVVVLRPDLKEAIALARRAGARVIVNPHPEEEMLLSIRMGIADLPQDLDGFFVWPADHPAVLPETLGELAAKADPRRVIVPVYRGRRGHPALVGGRLVSDIASIPPKEGLRHLWRLRPEALREVAVEDRGVIVNLDTPEDYENFSGSLDP